MVSFCSKMSRHGARYVRLSLHNKLLKRSCHDRPGPMGRLRPSILKGICRERRGRELDEHQPLMTIATTNNNAMHCRDGGGLHPVNRRSANAPSPPRMKGNCRISTVSRISPWKIPRVLLMFSLFLSPANPCSRVQFLFHFVSFQFILRRRRHVR